MKQWQSFLLVSVLVVFVSIYAGRDGIAQFAWTKYHNASVATILTKNAKLALEIGNYYFNGRGGYNLEKAESGFRHAIAIDDKILWGHYQLARVYFVKGKKGAYITNLIGHEHFRSAGQIVVSASQTAEINEEFK